jgi:hypothetical protein
MIKLTDYQRGLESVNGIPQFYLGQEVHTKDGTGIIVELKMKHNGLYIEPDSSEIVIWYSTEGAVDRIEGGRWITYTYKLTELALINYGRIRI